MAPRWRVRLSLRGTRRTQGMRRKLERLYRDVPGPLLSAADETVGKQAERAARDLPAETGLTGATMRLVYTTGRDGFTAELAVQSPYASTLPAARRVDDVSAARVRSAMRSNLRRLARKIRGR